MLKEALYRELKTLEILNKAKGIYFLNFQKIFILVFLFILPMSLIDAYITDSGLLMEFFRYQENSGIILFSNLFSSFSIFFIIISIMYLIKDSILENEKSNLSLADCSKQALSNFFNFFGTLLLEGIIIVFLSLLLVIPGIIWSNYYIFVVPIIFFKEISGKEALNYSKSIVEGQWWHILWKAIKLDFIPVTLVAILFFLFKKISFYFDFSSLTYFIIQYLFIYLFLSFILIIKTIFFINEDFLKNGIPSYEDEEDNENNFLKKTTI